MLFRSTLREIKNSLGRYIAILAIIALGVGFFAGLKVCRDEMVSTADDYLNESRFFDYQLMSTLGYDEDSVDYVAKALPDATVEGYNSYDVLVTSGDSDLVYKALSISENINRPELLAGRMPQSADECLIDKQAVDTGDGSVDGAIGSVVTISKENSEDTANAFKYDEYKVVGVAASPLYMNYERGTASIGDGSVSAFFYILPEGFDTDYFTGIYIDADIPGLIYSDEYNDGVDALEDDVTKAAEEAADLRREKIVDDARKELEEGRAEYEEGLAEYNAEKADAEARLQSALADIVSGEQEIENNRASLKNQRTELQASLEEINAGYAGIDQQQAQLDASKDFMSPEEAAAAQAQIDATRSRLDSSKAQVQSGLQQIESGLAQLDSAEADLAAGRAEYNSSKAEADREFAEAKAELDDAAKELEKAERNIEDIENPEVYVLNRESNVGYLCFDSDSQIVDSIAAIFPIFFFLVAALVCMTTMTRMVDEQRTQIGVFKALGYGSGRILGKYLFYSGSAALIGSVAGFAGGTVIFPTVIWSAYGMMYDFSDSINYVFNGPLAVLCVVVSLVCSMGATLFSCLGDFRIVPAELIRPKAPKSGKRILLERIHFIWNHLSFLYKVSFRNIFRYKKRFFMMVLGVSGCTALLLTGFGLNDSVRDIVNYQYDEISTYDYSVTFSDGRSEEEQEEFDEEISSYAEPAAFVHQESADLVMGSAAKNMTLIVTEGGSLDGFIDLHRGGEELSYPEDGQVIICKKYAEEYKIEPGDTVTLRDMDMHSAEFTVSGICDNYVMGYVYMTPETYKDAWGITAEYETAFVKVHDSENVYTAASETGSLSGVTAVSINAEFRDRVNTMMESLNAIIVLIVISAGALAFIVLYNLTNINITERIREIATIKVLGFYARETSSYVFREIFFLTGISAVVGLGLGKILHTFVINLIRVDMIYFEPRLVWPSYVYSVALTFLFAVIVMFVMYFKLQRISMTESLKSIE